MYREDRCLLFGLHKQLQCHVLHDIVSTRVFLEVAQHIIKYLKRKQHFSCISIFIANEIYTHLFKP